MTQATRRIFCVNIFSNPAMAITKKITQGIFAMIAMALLLGNTAIAQYEDEPVTIVPRTQLVSGQSTESQQSDSGAQQPTADPSAQSQPADSTFILPPGTSLPLGLVRPLALKQSTARGAGVYLQVTFPITVAGRMLVPPGAYVQGTIKALTINRGADPDLQFELQAASLIFSTGYTVPLTGTVQLVHKYALMQPGIGQQSAGQPIASLIPVGKTNLPSPIMAATGTAPTPAPLPTPGKGAFTGILVAGIAGTAAMITLTAISISHHHNDVYLDAGTPLEIILGEPLTLDARNVNSAVQLYSTQMATNPPDIVKPPVKMCYDPGSAGTPDTVIPGTPPSPPTVIPGVNGAPDTVIPGSPGTPDTVIPGTPGTVGGWYKCK